MKEYSFEVSKRDAGSRIDKWLTSALKMSRGRVKELIDSGRVLVNRRRVVIAGWELEANDHVMVRIPKQIQTFKLPEDEKEERKPAQKRISRHPVSHQRENKKTRVSALRNIGKPTLSYQKELSLSSERKKEREKTKPRRERGRKKRRTGEDKRYLKVHYRDKHIIVVDKPAGMLTVPQHGSDHPHVFGEVQNFLRKKYSGGRGSFVKPMHRLDNETSGVMVFAISNQGKRLEDQFRKHTINRRYFAVVYGAVEKEQGVIEAPLEKGRFGHGRKVRTARKEKGKMARTEFRVKERYAEATLLDVSVTTGRTHQVRVHLASKDHPLVGDKLYSDKHYDKIPFGRHALHAHTLGFRHPVTGKRMTFHSQLPPDMKQLVDDLRLG